MSRSVQASCDRSPQKALYLSLISIQPSLFPLNRANRANRTTFQEVNSKTSRGKVLGAPSARFRTSLGSRRFRSVQRTTQPTISCEATVTDPGKLGCEHVPQADIFLPPEALTELKLDE